VVARCVRCSSRPSMSVPFCRANWGPGRQEERGPSRNESRAGPCSSCGFQVGGGLTVPYLARPKPRVKARTLSSCGSHLNGIKGFVGREDR
jgi:hypothetical protein